MWILVLWLGSLSMMSPCASGLSFRRLLRTEVLITTTFASDLQKPTCTAFQPRNTCTSRIDIKRTQTACGYHNSRDQSQCRNRSIPGSWRALQWGKEPAIYHLCRFSSLVARPRTDLQ
ncbi:hypothetical protein C8Q73DRAFT_87437 [Cubamyces lactineus]|nr:hypothetical protein C8Q73DRAFT_87437 [Cubamyces lactineus]